MFENERRGQKGMEYPVLHLMQCITQKSNMDWPQLNIQSGYLAN